jgi:hypothetical protein
MGRNNSKNDWRKIMSNEEKINVNFVGKTSVTEESLEKACKIISKALEEVEN